MEIRKFHNTTTPVAMDLAELCDATALLLKPFHISSLLDTVQNALTGHGTPAPVMAPVAL